MADEAGGWELTESDPGLFSQLLWDLGVQGVEVEELHALDPALLADLEPIYAFVFLFKWRTAAQAPPPAGELKEPSVPHYFAQQKITNACATLAVLNALLNVHSPDISLGDELSNLQSFSVELDSETRGHVLTNSERIREVHNSFARSDPFDLSEYDPDREPPDAFHFIAFAPIGGELYELDGLKHAPISHGPVLNGQAGFIARATAVIQDRIATYGEAELHFNLMAIVGDRIQALQKRIAALETQSGSMVNDVAQAEAVNQRAELEGALADEQAKRERWAFETSMRRHNHLGLVHALLAKMAEHGKLDERIAEAKKAQVAKQQKQKQGKS